MVRLAFGLGLLLSAATAESLASMAGFTFLAMFALAVSGEHRLLSRMFKLAMWMSGPLFVLHAWFTPGKLCIDGWWWGPTYDGMKAGGFLAAKMLLMFMAAGAFARSLSIDEWFMLLMKLPRYGARMAPYLLLFRPIFAHLHPKWREDFLHWRARPQVRNAAGFIGLVRTMLDESLKEGSEYGRMLWLRWGERNTFVPRPSRMEAISAVLIFVTFLFV